MADENEQYSIDYQYSDSNPNKWIIQLNTQDETQSVEVQLEATGLYELNSINGNVSYSIVWAIHRFIRDIYHKHIHHSGDIPLHPVEAGNKEDAILQLLTQYRNKVRDYHQEAQDYLNVGRLEDAIDIIFSGRGEMQFAKSFANIFFVGDEKKNLIQTFQISDDSLGILLEKAKTKIIKLSEQRKHSVNLIITTFLTFLTLFGVLNTFPAQSLSWEFNLIISFLASVMVMVFVDFFFPT